METIEVDMQTKTVIINGKPWKINAQAKLHYRHLVKMVFNVEKDSTEVFTVTFSGGYLDKPNGSLTEGEYVKVREGMIFNVANTGGA